MKNSSILLLFLIVFTSCISIRADITAPENSEVTSTPNVSFSDDEASIRLVLSQQEIAWNNHDLEGFMQGYWHDDDLTFYGSNGVTKGWEQTLANYKKAYPSKKESGLLEFTIKNISKIDQQSYSVVGSYFLTREIGNANGIFMIIFRKINGEWKIVADMTC
jgi:hypothetical protein